MSVRRELRVGERLLAGLEGALDEVAREQLELGARQRASRWSGSPFALCAMNGRLISVSSDDESSCFAFSAASFRRWSAIRSLRRSTPCSFSKALGEAVDDAPVEVFAAEVRVAARRLDAEDAASDLEDRDVERAAAEVVDGDALGVLLLEAVGERGRGRLVDDALDVEAGDLARVLRRLPLRVVEVGGHGDHRFGDGLAEEGLGDLAHLREDDRADLGRRHLAPADRDPGVAVRRLDDLVRRQLAPAAAPRGRSNLRPIRRLTA